ncbi:MAG: dTDP-4-dehydrorhamnose 3,5-epimerase [Bacteroidia bacterium]
MPFEAEALPLLGAYLLTPRVYADPRGYFLEFYLQKSLEALNLNTTWVQDNLSYSTHGVLRGLHFQLPPHAQAKLVCVLQGRVQDVIVDLRKSSPTYGKHLSIELSAERIQLLYIPEGFAHGFLVLSSSCMFYYKCSTYYAASHDGGIRWDDPDLGITWHMQPLVVSNKDNTLPLWRDFDSPF